MSAYEYLSVETVPEHAIVQQIMQLEARMFAASARIRAAARAGDRDELVSANAAHQAYARDIDALLLEQDRRAAALLLEQQAGEHPPILAGMEEL